MEMNPDTGEMKMEVEYMNEQFDEYIPDEVHFNPDGTMDVKMPEGTSYDAEAHQIKFPEGSMHMDEIPSELEATMNEDGSITVQMQDGMNYDAEGNSVHLDNYWTNELSPDPVEFHEDGSMHVDMPGDCQYHSDGSCTIPPEHADFMEHGEPEYCDDGPDWVDGNPDGSITVEPPEGITVNPGDGTLSMSIEMAEEQFPIPEEFDIHPDGTADIKVPEGTEYNPDEGSLTFPAGEVHMHEMPDGIEAQLNEDGTITAQLPEGMNYNADGGTVHMNNEWVNNMTPDPINISPEGEFVVNLPEGTEYYEGGFVIPAEQVDFLDEPQN